MEGWWDIERKERCGGSERTWDGVGTEGKKRKRRIGGGRSQPSDRRLTEEQTQRAAEKCL